MSKQDANKFTLKKLIEFHLDSSVDNSTNELEIRFGTKAPFDAKSRLDIKPISSIDFMNVISKLKSLQYTVAHGNEEGNHSLKVQTEFIDPKTGKTKLSNVRTEISGLYNIKDYCQNNSIEQLIKSNSSDISLITKQYCKDANNEDIRPVNVDSFNFRISYQKETNINKSSQFGNKILSEIDSSKKMFRLVNRVSYIHKDYPVRVDLSITKQSDYDKTKKRSKMSYKIGESNVLNNAEKYEIEIEVLNHLLGPGRVYNKDNVDKLEKDIKTVITHVLSGLQGTNYPISYEEQSKVKMDYLKLINGKEIERRNSKLFSNDFCGPSSFTLQMKHIQELSDDNDIPNIRNYYTVTEKADGMRKLLYINNKGKLYFITTNMNIQYTGVTITNKKLFNSLLDGEHILHNKVGNYINHYAAFDIYFINERSHREKSFMYIDNDSLEENFRLPLLINFIDEMNIKKTSKDADYPIHIQYKNFLVDTNGDNIFQLCGELLKRTESNYFEYETDGLIFTPIKNGVAGNKAGVAGSLRKPTWEYSFKWKPPKFNTIDFLVTTKKDDSSQDIVGNIFNGGIDLSSQEQISHYKVIELRVGFNIKQHGYINPVNDVINDNIPKSDDIDDKTTYKPMLFYPTNPSDDQTHICHILLKQDDTGKYQMMTEEGEVFDDKTIVEFRYELNNENKFRWIPLRVRYDKTIEFKKGESEYGNAYHVANSNWYSIHNPISEEILSTGLGIPVIDDNVYYNRSGVKSIGENTVCMRDFHNKYVKKKLIKSVSNRGDTLIDFAVGKGGDLAKWIDAKLDFVFGIDVNKDNIEHSIDGAAARYLNLRKEYKVMPKALFVNGNSSDNIRNGSALYSDKDKMITQAIFGNGPKDENQLGRGVYKQYGKGHKGFNVSSCQFALHYFFEDKDKLSSFVTNVCETTKLNGYFIGTCYDGKKIFNSLKNKNKEESLILMKNEAKIWEVEKLYGFNEFKNDVSSLGYAINVYQESINKPFVEFLVNFDYFKEVMERFGFSVLSDDEANELGLPHSIGSFEELFSSMTKEVSRNKFVENNYGCAKSMSSEEKQISYYNNYFVFKKIREVDANQLQLKDDVLTQQAVKEEVVEVIESVKKADADGKKVKKRGKKVKLVEKSKD